MHQHFHSVRLVALTCSALFVGLACPARAQVPGECTAPAEGRAKELGCYLLAQTAIARLPSRGAYWHIVWYRSERSARADRQAEQTVVRSLGKTWLFAIADRRWRPRHGLAVASIGPLPVPLAAGYTARFMEAVSVSGMQSTIHRHSGPEAWYVVSGTQCLETQTGKQIIAAGHTGSVPAGPAMRLGTLGSAKRQALVLVLHDSSKPWMSMADDWTPNGLCKS